VSYIRSYIIQSTDVSLHHTSVTFDAHLGEILGTAMMGGLVILLQPDGHFDIEAFVKTISYQQVTYMGTVPSQVNELVAFLHDKNEDNSLKTLRCISSGGKI
jgi:acyl-CoA synthetase (AMP-forming)/AMP-acid ligase II